MRTRESKPQGPARAAFETPVSRGATVAARRPHALGNQAMQHLLLEERRRGHGEEPQPAQPVPAVQPATPAPACGCSNLRLGEDRYEGARKHVKILFDVAPGADPTQCVLVQQVRGAKYLEMTTGSAERDYPMAIPILGESKKFNFRDWELDSIDQDPVMGSSSKARWQYTRESETTFSIVDSPSMLEPYPAARAISAAQFKTSLYRARDVPTTLSGPSQLGEPLATLEWEDSTCWEHGKEPTHPKLGEACPPAAAPESKP